MEMVINFIGGFLLFFVLFLVIRNNHTHKVRALAIDSIYKYSLNCVESGVYENLYKKMMKGYNKLLFELFNFSKTGAVKDEYLDILTPYFE